MKDTRGNTFFPLLFFYTEEREKKGEKKRSEEMGGEIRETFRKKQGSSIIDE